MSQAIVDQEITPVWQSLNNLTGISVGTKMIIENKGVGSVLLSEGTQPTTDSIDGVLLTQTALNQSIKIVEVGSLEIWARLQATSGTSLISIQRG